ncbi:hypothetical protein [Pelagibacterium sp.]|uniref:hypothetical protein n=1 Tax=Pelagibacterium sp. TaxID=1967288 RepID=UPI003A912920
MKPAQVPAVSRYITLSEAAELADRSYSWARDRAVIGTFEVKRLPSGRILVALDTVITELRNLRPKQGSHLRLVVDNTK